ncbi:UNVERIFIED_ORG: ABC-type branched-subunit amino acid transport system substrate-binding protein [Paraburkholderia sediminicola]|nr:ABC-type branched-subunit amino acid transport system substrate-binding protein [Paraburkholderia sediminicola]
MFELSQYRKQLLAIGVAISLHLPFATAHEFAQETVVQVGLAAPTTCLDADYGKGTENSTQLATDEVNATKVVIGGKPVKSQLVRVNDRGDLRTALHVARQLVGKDGGIVAANPAITQGTQSTLCRVMSIEPQNSVTAGLYAMTR